MATGWLLSLLAENTARVIKQATSSRKAAVWSMVAEWPKGHSYDTERATIEVTIKGDAQPILLTPAEVLEAISHGAEVFDFRIPLLSAGAFGASAAAVLAVPAPVDEVFCLFARDLRETSMAVAQSREGAFMGGARKGRVTRYLAELNDPTVTRGHLAGTAAVEVFAEPDALNGTDGATPIRALRAWALSRGMLVAIPPDRIAVDEDGTALTTLAGPWIEPLFSHSRRARVGDRAVTRLGEEIGVGLHSPNVTDAPQLRELEWPHLVPDSDYSFVIAIDRPQGVDHYVFRSTWEELQARASVKLRRYVATLYQVCLRPSHRLPGRRRVISIESLEAVGEDESSQIDPLAAPPIDRLLFSLWSPALPTCDAGPDTCQDSCSQSSPFQ